MATSDKVKDTENIIKEKNESTHLDGTLETYQSIKNNQDEQDSDLWSDADEDELAQIDYRISQDSNLKWPEDRLECDQIIRSEDGTPQSLYRPNYLIVSDLARQSWCEIQLLYSLAPDIILLRALPGEEVKLEESETAKAAKGKGTDIHLERELEIQVPVEVKVESLEDRWAVKLINLQHAVLAFNSGQKVAREIPVFGCPFNCGLFVFGIIDELKYDPDSHTVEISELKTRRFRSKPKRAQQEKDKYQVKLYAQLFNELVQGKVNKNMMTDHLNLNLDMALGGDVVKHVSSVNGKGSNDSITFGDLLEVVLSQVQSLCCISSSSVEYIYQEDKSEILTLHFALDDTEPFRGEFLKHCQWWRGERGTTGVDIEDCWKCDMCQFSPLCEWRDFMAHKLSKRKLTGVVK